MYHHVIVCNHVKKMEVVKAAKDNKTYLFEKVSYKLTDVGM